MIEYLWYIIKVLGLIGLIIFLLIIIFSMLKVSSEQSRREEERIELHQAIMDIIKQENKEKEEDK